MTTCRTIIRRALGELLYIAEGEDPSASTLADSLDALNALIASWHTDGMLIFYPPGTNWRGDWASNTTYAVSDSVCRSGSTYTCSVAHTSSLYDKPGVSANWSDYWTVYRETPKAAGDDFPLPPEFERGVASMLAVEIGPMFGVDPRPLTLRKASECKTALLAAYLPINPVRVDNGIIRMPSQIWPYNIDQVS